jgi:hypothetical protein
MLTDISITLLIIAGITGLYYLVLSIVYKRKLVYSTYKPGKGLLPKNRLYSNELPHQLIDRPGLAEEEIAVLFKPKADEPDALIEMVDDEDSALLKAAEIVVEKIQDVVTHIASSPPSHEEVYSKIRNVVNQYRIFHDTEYFDAINSFISITVERDCSIKFSKDELLSLWN